MKAILGGELVDLDAVSIGAADRGFTHGDGLFETLRTYGGEPFLLDRHLRRLRRSADFFALKLPFSDSEVHGWVLDLIEAEALAHARVRLTVARGPAAGLDHALGPPTVLVTATQLPEAGDRTPLKVGLATWARHSSDPLTRHKTLSYLGNLAALARARSAGLHEAVFLNERAALTEGCVSNLFWVRGGRVFTPSENQGLLPGITRGLVVELCAGQGLEAVLVEDAPPEQAAGADEVFLTNSVREIAPVGEFAGRPVPAAPGPVTARLIKAYSNLVERTGCVL